MFLRQTLTICICFALLFCLKIYILFLFCVLGNGDAQLNGKEVETEVENVGSEIGNETCASVITEDDRGEYRQAPPLSVVYYDESGPHLFFSSDFLSTYLVGNF